MKVEPVFCSVIVTGVISSAHENDHYELQGSQDPETVYFVWELRATQP